MKTIRLDPQIFSMAQAAKYLDNTNRLTEIKLKRELQSRGILISKDGSLVPSPKLEKGYFTIQPRTFYIRGSIPHHYNVTLVTLKGLAWLADVLTKTPTHGETA